MWKIIFSLLLLFSETLSHQLIVITLHNSCNTECQKLYNDDSSKKSCERGCRLFTMTDASFPQHENETLINCSKSCKDSYKESTKDETACSDGCKIMEPFLKSQKSKLLTFPQRQSFFEDIPRLFNDIPTFFSSFPFFSQSLNKEEKERDSMGFHSMESVMERMRGMISSIEKQFNSELHSNNAKGKVLVIQGKPNTLQFDHMINRKNPLDMMNNQGFEESYEFPSNNLMFDDDEPRLPESGLKTRFIFHGDACSGNPSDLKWSDWASCLHFRIGKLRWLTAAAISLGIIFTLWLCLTFPHGSQKQKILLKASKKAAKEKEAEAQSSISILEIKDHEAPPPYEDLRVSLVPIHDKSDAHSKA